MELTEWRRIVVNEVPTAAAWKAGELCYAVAFNQTVFCYTLGQSHANQG